MKKIMRRSSCYNCLALDGLDGCKPWHCYLGNEVEPHQHLTKYGLVNTAKPLCACSKPQSNKLYVSELQERIRILEEAVRILTGRGN